MRVYKGFNKKIQAKHGKGTFQYEKGKTYKEEKSKTRSTGFHAAEYILDCLQWYPIDGKNKFFLCEAGGSIDEEDGCSMVVSTELTLIRELTLMEIEEYKDYLSMCEACCKNMADEMVYRPRELKRRHDEVVIDQQQIQILKELENNAEGKEAYAQEMRQKFPEAEGILKEIKSRYEYEDEEYKIIVPNTLVDIVKEGRALHHCAGSSERYFDRIESRETYICFLRRQETPGIPFYTIEVEPGGTIRQHRSYYDEEPGIEEIRVFLKSWQKAIRKRLTEEDKKLAKISKIKREANIAELEEKKNIRVLQGLAEDFLEAEEIEKELEAV